MQQFYPQDLNSSDSLSAYGAATLAAATAAAAEAVPTPLEAAHAPRPRAKRPRPARPPKQGAQRPRKPRKQVKIDEDAAYGGGRGQQRKRRKRGKRDECDDDDEFDLNVDNGYRDAEGASGFYAGQSQVGELAAGAGGLDSRLAQLGGQILTSETAIARLLERELGGKQLHLLFKRQDDGRVTFLITAAPADWKARGSNESRLKSADNDVASGAKMLQHELRTDEVGARPGATAVWQLGGEVHAANRYVAETSMSGGTNGMLEQQTVAAAEVEAHGTRGND